MFPVASMNDLSKSHGLRKRQFYRQVHQRALMFDPASARRDNKHRKTTIVCLKERHINSITYVYRGLPNPGSQWETEITWSKDKMTFEWKSSLSLQFVKTCPSRKKKQLQPLGHRDGPKIYRFWQGPPAAPRERSRSRGRGHVWTKSSCYATESYTIFWCTPNPSSYM